MVTLARAAHRFPRCRQRATPPVHPRALVTYSFLANLIDLNLPRSTFEQLNTCNTKMIELELASFTANLTASFLRDNTKFFSHMRIFKLKKVCGYSAFGT